MEKDSKSGAGLVSLSLSLCLPFLGVCVWTRACVCVMGVSWSELKRNGLHKAFKYRCSVVTQWCWFLWQFHQVKYIHFNAVPPPPHTHTYVYICMFFCVLMIDFVLNVISWQAAVCVWSFQMRLWRINHMMDTLTTYQQVKPIFSLLLKFDIWAPCWQSDIGNCANLSCVIVSWWI